MTDLSLTVAPKSDQLNADDLIPGPMTITITRVSANEGSAEQPISIYFERDGGKPYKPCKSMRRVLLMVWGKDGTTYPGRSMTLYRDSKVQFGGLAVGGIRISHMSHIDQDITVVLTATKASRKPFTVRPLAEQKPTTKPTQTPMEWFTAKIASLGSREDCTRLLTLPKIKKSFDEQSETDRGIITDMLAEKTASFLSGPTTPPDDDDFPGQVTPREEVG